MKNELFKISEEEKINILESHNVYKSKPKFNVSFESLFEQKPPKPSKTERTTTNDNPENQSTGLPAWTNDYPALKEIGKLKKTTLDTQVANIEPTNEDNHYFNKDKSYIYIDTKDNTKVYGTWDIQDGHLIINTEDGEQWTEAGGWKPTWKKIAEDKFKELEAAGKKIGKEIIKLGTSFFEKITSSSNTQQQNTTQNNTSNRLSGVYTKCDETFPILRGCKNETIKKLQACIGVLPDGKFGPVTQEKLESLDLLGTRITADSLAKACKEQSNSTTQSGSATQSGSVTQSGVRTNDRTSADYYSDYQTDEIETAINKVNSPYGDYSDSDAVEGDETTQQTTSQSTPTTTQNIPQIRKKITDMNNIELALTKQNTPLMFKNMYDKLGAIQKKIVDDKLSGKTK